MLLQAGFVTRHGGTGVAVSPSVHGARKTWTDQAQAEHCAGILQTFLCSWDQKWLQNPVRE